MRELNKQDMIDLLYGCAVLGTGWWQISLLTVWLFRRTFQKGKTLKLITFR